MKSHKILFKYLYMYTFFKINQFSGITISLNLNVFNPDKPNPKAISFPSIEHSNFTPDFWY